MVYLDQAATSYPKLDVVQQAVLNAMQIAGSANRSTNLDASRLIYETRKKVADFFGVFDFHHVIFNSGNTESLNTCIKGILKKEDHVITTYDQHNSVLRPLHDVGCLFDVCAPNLKEIKKRIQSNTRMVILNHSSNVTGQICDIDQIGAYCRNHHILVLVDVAQSAGHIPVSMENVDILCFSGHKGLLGIGGIGGICLKENIEIRPLISGGTGMDSFDLQMPAFYPEHLEAGTQNLVGIAALNAGVTYVKEHFLEIQKKEKELLKYLYDGLNGYVHFYSQLENSTPVVAFSMDGKESAWISDVLYAKYGIITRCGVHCAPLMHQHLNSEKQGLVRLSLSFQNIIEDIDRVIQAIREISNDY